MKQRTRSIIVIALWSFTGFCLYSIYGGGEDAPRGADKISAVVECQEEIKSKLGPLGADFDNAFAYKGTKTIDKGSRYQVAGKVNGKHYGCFVNYAGGVYIVEAIL